MNARVLGLRALPLTFSVFVLEALLALFATFPLGVEFSSRLHAFAGPAFMQAAALDQARLHELGAIALGFARAHLLSIVAVLFLSPWLQMSWLSALSEPQSPLRAFGRGARQLPRAWLTSLALGCAFTIVIAPCVGLAYAVSRVFENDANAQRADLSLLFSLIPLVLVALWFYVVHDLARAASLEKRTFRSLTRAFVVALRPSAFAPALGAMLVGIVLPLATHAATWQLSAWTATMLLQGVLFVRLLVRAAWLGHALACVRDPIVPMVDRKYDE